MIIHYIIGDKQSTKWKIDIFSYEHACCAARTTSSKKQSFVCYELDGRLTQKASEDLFEETKSHD